MVYAALLDTSVVIDLESIGDQQVAATLGVDISEFRPGISTVTLAELAAGPHATNDPAERAVRKARLQWAEAVFAPLGFDEDAARAYGVVCALVRAARSSGLKDARPVVGSLTCSSPRSRSPTACHC
jgi:predicted nucleic acid-binding protein